MNGLHATRARLAIHASIEAAGEQVDVTVSYLRQPATPVRLASKQFPITGTGQQQFSLDVDIGACLDDAQRVPGTAGGCSLLAAVVLRDAAGVLIDSANVGPIDAASGATANAPSVRLQAAETIEVVDGDQQLGWPGQALFYPVVLRVLDRAGAPIGRRGVTVTPPTGGAVVTQGALVTDDTGVVRVDLRLATTEGQQQFTVRSAGGGTPAVRTVSAYSTAPRRDRLGVGFATCLGAGNAGTNYCWSTYVIGTRVLGNGSTSTAPVPTPMAMTSPLMAVSLSKGNSWGDGTACGLTPVGEAWCWGLNEGGYLGVPSDSTCAGLSGLPSVPCTTVPRRLPGNQAFATLAVGANRHPPPVQGSPICAITTAGVLTCWGNNAFGALGDGTTISRGSPVAVMPTERFVQVTMGDDFGCAVTGRGETWCWGYNGFGQLGDGTTQQRESPVRIQGGQRLVALSAGASAVCGIDIASDAWCWGRDFMDGSARASPLRMAGGVKVRAVSVGWANYWCALTTNSQTMCAGRGGAALGHGSLTDSSTVLRPVVGVPAVASVVTAGLSSTCALFIGDDLYCWGTAGWDGFGMGVTVGSGRGVRVNLTGQAPGSPTSLVPISGVNGLRSAISNPAPALTVRVTDANGFGVGGVQLRLAVVSGGGSAPTSTVNTNATGFAALSGAYVGATPGPNDFEISLVSNPAIKLAFTVTAVMPGPPAQLFCNLGCVATTPVGTTYNFASLPSFGVRDSAGFPVANVAVAVTAARPGIVTSPTLPASLTTDVTGFTRLNTWTADTVARTDTLTVSVAGAPGIAPALLVLRAVPAAPQRVVFASTGPLTGVKAGTIVGPIVVHLRDQYQNVTTNAAATPVTLSLTAAPPGGTLSGTTTVTATGGVATFSDITFSVPGAYTMLVSSGSLATSTIAWAIVP